MCRDSPGARPARRLGFGALIALAVSILLSGCNDRPDSATSGELTVGAVGACAEIAEGAARVFEQQYPHASIRVVPMDGLRATEALLKGDVGLIIQSRDIVGEERRAAESIDARLSSVPIAVDGLAAIVREDNPVRSLAAEDVRDIAAGRLRSWAALGGHAEPIIVIAPDPLTGTGGYMREVFTRDMSSPARNLFVLPSDSAVVADIRQRADGIGFVRASLRESQPDLFAGVRVLNVAARRPAVVDSAVAPVQQTLADGSYPLTSYMTAVTRGAPRGVAAGFASFLASDRGQLIVQRLGFAPVSVAAYEVHLR